MLIGVHVAIALAGLLVVGMAVLSPSVGRINFGWGLYFGTLFSGTVLVFSTASSLTTACISGLAYSSLALSGLAVARWRLANQKTQN